MSSTLLYLVAAFVAIACSSCGNTTQFSNGDRKNAPPPDSDVPTRDVRANYGRYRPNTGKNSFSLANYETSRNDVREGCNVEAEDSSQPSFRLWGTKLTAHDSGVVSLTVKLNCGESDIRALGANAVMLRLRYEDCETGQGNKGYDAEYDLSASLSSGNGTWHGDIAANDRCIGVTLELKLAPENRTLIRGTVLVGWQK